MSEAQKKDQADPGAEAPGMLQEADIGSGETTPGEQDTQAMIESIPPLPQDQAVDAAKKN